MISGKNVLTNIVYLENKDLEENGLQLYEFIKLLRCTGIRLFFCGN